MAPAGAPPCSLPLSMPGLVPPVYEAGDLLVDGGYLNNIPVDVMKSLGVGRGAWLLLCWTGNAC